MARRPSGTDGSDFSYRMVVDSRYTKVAKGKSRLCALILTQVVIQLIGLLYIVGLLVQIFTIGTIIALIGNISPPKKAY
ncbi:hypothetical protein MANES_03G110816v8 [Manihot esculenta]|uniref:Uncharacterized protein n=1 Tax=Manihot esculenta TaxID=3983 RepID=A0ACB7HYW3_MANES|nr:hypothetical protein MANES_03G110816v8 [Manihot esculenta]